MFKIIQNFFRNKSPSIEHVVDCRLVDKRHKNTNTPEETRRSLFLAKFTWNEKLTAGLAKMIEKKPLGVAARRELKKMMQYNYSKAGLYTLINNYEILDIAVATKEEKAQCEKSSAFLNKVYSFVYLNQK